MQSNATAAAFSFADIVIHRNAEISCVVIDAFIFLLQWILSDALLFFASERDEMHLLHTLCVGAYV